MGLEWCNGARRGPRVRDHDDGDDPCRRIQVVYDLLQFRHKNG